MRRCPDHFRSIFFWSGLLVIVFTAWAGGYSCYREMTWRYTLAGEHRIGLKSSNGWVSFVDIQVHNVPPPRGFYFDSTGWFGKFSSGIAPASPEKFPSVAIDRKFAPIHTSPPSGYGVQRVRYIVAYWVVVLTMIPPWLLVSLWRARRIGRVRRVVGLGAGRDGGETSAVREGDTL